MAKKSKRSYPGIIDLAERLYAAEEKLAAEPGDEVLRRIVSNLRSDKGRYRYEGIGGEASLLITVADWERVENGEAVPVSVYGGGYRLISTEEYRAGRERGAILFESERRRRRAQIRREVNAAVAQGPAAVLDLVHQAIDRFEKATS